MRAAVVTTFGGPEAAHVTDVPEPVAGPGQLTVRVAAAAINPVDVATRTGYLAGAGLQAAQDVYALGWDVAGTVVGIAPLAEGATGAGSASGADGRLALDDRVIGLSLNMSATAGAQAELVVLDTGAVALAPTTWSMEEASTLPLAGSTALQALAAAGPADGGARPLLVTGAAGAVGAIAVQVAAHEGREVVALARASDRDAVLAWGAKDFAETLDEVARLVPGGVGAVIDAAHLGAPVLDVVADGGTFVEVLPGTAPGPARGITVVSVSVAAEVRDLERLVALADTGVLVPRVAAVHTFDDVAAAHARVEASGVRGKVVLVP